LTKVTKPSLKKVKLNLASDRYSKDQTHLLRNPYIPKSSSFQQSKPQNTNNGSFNCHNKSEADQYDKDDKENEQTLNNDKPKIEAE
jgi:hypothetical protein